VDNVGAQEGGGEVSMAQGAPPAVAPEEQVNRNLNAMTLSESGASAASSIHPPAPPSSTDDIALCIVCMEWPTVATLIHGETGHECCCMTCARLLKERATGCPICRLPIEAVIRSFKM
jgi:hypothetical protein